MKRRTKKKSERKVNRNTATWICFCAILLCGYIFVGDSIGTPSQGNEPYWNRESSRLYVMFSKVKDGIVYCYSDGSKTTGFIVSKYDGEGCWVMTAGHKVDPDFPMADEIHVKLSRTEDAKIFKSIKTVAPLKEYDLLLFKIPYKPKFHFRDFETPHMLEENWVFGYRGNANYAPSSAGYVTTNIRKPHYFYSTAPILSGNSGSPILNRQGKVLGVAVEGIFGSDCMFVPAGIAKQYIKDTLENEKKEKELTNFRRDPRYEW